MPRYDFRTPRIYVDVPLNEGTIVALEAAQTNHLVNVLRAKPGDIVLVFNGREGEWQALVEEPRKRVRTLAVKARIRPQDPLADLHYLFAPLKHARLDYLVQKAVEMGASRLQPVLTQHVQVTRINLDRMRSNAIEAAQQCGILTLPQIEAPLPLERVMAAREPGRLLVFCDEEAPAQDPVAALAKARPAQAARPLPLAVLIGPEGGFSPDERAALTRLPNVVQLALGPRILRADTAAVAALAVIQAVLGDWQ